jgi:serine/threonine-protein kinase HipA
MTVANVNLWGERIGAVAVERSGEYAIFEYDPAFIGRGIEPSPIEMPVGRSQFRFPGLPYETFAGLPGMLADALPDRFGNRLIDQYLAARGTPRSEFDAVQRLCYVGSRAMGALEFEPSTGPAPQPDHQIDISALRALASDVLEERTNWTADMTDEGAVRDILQVGTSAGGARAKAVVAWNPDTGELRSGQATAPPGFEHWIIKFDGVSDSGREVGAGHGYGMIEYAYALMAQRAGIEMSTCRLLEEHGRSHFMTRRFDRVGPSSRLHLQSFGGLCHFDFNVPGAHSYEQALLAIRQLDLAPSAREEQFRRMLFNVVARNQDDHVKNIAFLMAPDGRWSLSPAFDVTYAYNPDGTFTSAHQMTINGKRSDFTLADFKTCAEVAILPRSRWRSVLDEVVAAVRSWPDFADEAGVPEETADLIAATHRLEFDQG